MRKYLEVKCIGGKTLINLEEIEAITCDDEYTEITLFFKSSRHLLIYDEDNSKFINRTYKKIRNELKKLEVQDNE